MSTLSFEHLTFGGFLDAIGAKTPTPGGGAVASGVGALAAALAEMVVNYSAGKKNLAPHEPALQASLALLRRTRGLLLRLADEDAQAYGAVNELSRLPENDPRRSALGEAQAAAVQAPLSALAACADLLRHLDALPGITNRHLRSDLAIAAVLAEAGARSCWWNVAINAPSLSDAPSRERLMNEASGMLLHAETLRKSIESRCAP